MKEHRLVGSQLRVARTFAGITQAELATEIACDQSLIGHLERGTKQPSPTVIDALGAALGFAPSFFSQPTIDEFRDEDCNFRRRRQTSVSTRAQALSYGTLFAQLVRYLDACLELPPDNVPVSGVQDSDPLDAVERAAEMCRMRWGLGLDRPADGMCRILEASGAVVTRIESASDDVDAFSRAGGRHVVVLTTNKNCASRSRFDAAHELGHLVMHRGRPTGTPSTEAQADRFASAFLLPRAGFMREFPRGREVNWDVVFSIKQHWGVSAAAIVRRAFDLRLIDAAQYQRANKLMAYKRWRHIGEPFEPAAEQAETVQAAFAALKESFGESAVDVSEKLGWRGTVLRRVVGFDMPDDLPGPEKGKLVFLDSRRAGGPPPADDAAKA